MKYSTSHLFPKPMVYVSYLMLLLGVVKLVTGGFVGIIVIILGILFGFSKQGVEVENKKIREFNQYFWIKFGKWINLKEYPYLCILKITEKQKINSARTNIGSSYKTMVYRLTLLNHNHYKKLHLEQYEDETIAEANAQEISALLGVKRVTFSPGYSKDDED